MRVPALMRQSLAGRLIYHASGRRIWRYDEEKPEYVFPARYARLLKKKKSEAATLIKEDVNNSNPPEARKEGDTMKERSALKDFSRPIGDEMQEEPRHSAVSDASELRESEEHVHQLVGNTQDIEKGVAPDAPKIHPDDPFVVTWDSHDDPENPRNWSFPKRCFVTFSICLLTFSIYIGSAIYSPGILSLSEQYHISPVAGSLGITLFVLGYGLGPMVLSPLSEIPQIGRTTVYIVSLFLFVIMQVPIALAKNLGTLLPLRFLAGFVGSPPLATGGASLTDMWADEWRAVVMGLWGVAAVSGPVLGPVVGGFAVMAEGWTWTIWILMWLSGTSLVFLAVFLPETSSQALLYRRAVRIRRLTGDTRFKSKGEIEAENMKISEIAQMTLVRPFVLCFTEPIVLFWNIYIALVYGILYIFITSFNVVFIESHGFNLGENGLAFLGLIVGVTITYALYALWAVRVLRHMYANETFTPEKRLPVAMVGAVLFPISMFWFGWTSAPSIHWILPIFGSAIFAGATFCLFSAGINYLPDCYPRHVASILAGNDLVRSCVGAAFPLFSTAFFHNLGVGPACSILGGIAVLMMPLPFVLYRNGEKIRSWSKYAN